MKQLILIFIFALFSCQKEDAVEKATKHTYVDPDAEVDASLRDGTKLPFDFPISQVIMDVFSNGRPVVAFNQAKIVKATYMKYSDEGVGFQGVVWKPYVTSKYFNDSTVLVRKVFAPATLGDFATIMPNANYNQLNPDNPYNFIKFAFTRKYDLVFDMTCGKQKRRYEYIVTTSTDSTIVNTYDGDRCNSHIFNYKLIF